MDPTADGGQQPLEALPAALLVFDGDRVEWTNAAARAELARPAEALIGTGFADELHPDSREALAAALEDPGRHDAAAGSLTVRRPSGDGRDEFFELRLGSPAGGRITALVVDVTEQHRLDAALAALASSNVALDGAANMVWRPFGNAERFGVADDAALGARVLEWIHPEDLPGMLEIFSRIVEEPGLKITELVRMRHPYIEDGWIVSRVTGVNRLDDPAIGAIVVRTEDATGVDLVEDLTQTTGRFNSLAEAAPVGIVVTDPAGEVLYRNELARDLLGIDHEVVGRTDWLASVRSDSADELDRVLRAAREEQHRGTLLVALERGGDVATWVRVDAVPQVDEEGTPFGLIATLLDVTSETEARRQLADAQDRLWHLATHDPLTNLANRVLFLDRVEQALDRRARGELAVAVLYCDLDGFKPVNDRYGHTVGDAVLRVVADRLASHVRTTDVLCRFGGDEFLVLCEGFADDAEVDALASRLVAAIQEPIEVGGEIITIGMTVGVAHATAQSEVDELITVADDSMYARKATGTEARARAAHGRPGGDPTAQAPG